MIPDFLLPVTPLLQLRLGWGGGRGEGGGAPLLGKGTLSSSSSSSAAFSACYLAARDWLQAAWRPLIPAIAEHRVAATVATTGVLASLAYLLWPAETRRQQTRKRRRKTGNLSCNDGGVYVHGLLNSANWCYMNAVVQALASLRYLREYPSLAESRPGRREDLQGSLTAALTELLETLLAPSARRQSIRPTGLISALEMRAGSAMSLQQQDAHELLLVILSAIAEEAVGALGPGATSLADAVGLSRSSKLHSNGLWKRRRPGLASTPELRTCLAATPRFPFHGLTASKVTCMQCGYTSGSAIRHCQFEHLTLTVPQTSSCRLEDRLARWTKPEPIDGFDCRKCSLQETLKILDRDLARMEHKSRSERESSRKRIEDLRAWRAKVDTALRDDVEMDLSPVPIEKVCTRSAMLQTMVARPPRILAVHLARSSYDAFGGAKKNDAAVVVPTFLDFTPFCTPGIDLVLSPLVRESREGVAYELSAAVCHYGPHESGHFTAYCRRRRPTSAARKRRRKKVREAGCDGLADSTSGKSRHRTDNYDGGVGEGTSVTRDSQIMDSRAQSPEESAGFAGKERKTSSESGTPSSMDDAGHDEWFEISDETVSRVEDIDSELRRAGRAVYMVFYEVTA